VPTLGCLSWASGFSWMGHGPEKREGVGVGSVREKGKKDGWASREESAQGFKSFLKFFLLFKLSSN
jgi:hypothetical protein